MLMMPTPKDFSRATWEAMAICAGGAAMALVCLIVLLFIARRWRTVQGRGFLVRFQRTLLLRRRLVVIAREPIAQVLAVLRRFGVRITEGRR